MTPSTFDHPNSAMQKPKLGFWQIWNMSFGFLGIQIGFMLAQANMPRIFQTMGADVDKLGFLMIAGPVTGLLVQPVIGYLSDRTWGSLGRRRPYFTIGAIIASLALLAAPHSSALWMAASMLWIMDAANNISMEPFRAFVGDLLPKEQVTKGFAFQTFFISVGAVFAAALPYIFTNWFGVANVAPQGQIPESVLYAFYVGAAAFFGAVMWTVAKTKEYSPAEMEKFHPRTETAAATGAASGTADFFKEYARMPRTMVQLAVVQFFTWFAWAAMWNYGTAVVTQHIYGTSDTTSSLYNEGANWLGICYVAYSVSSGIFAFLLPLLAQKTSRKATHAICLAIGGLSFVSIYFATSPIAFLLPFIGIGLAWASTLSMPYAILACTLPANKMGTYMGMFNMFIVIPQIVSNSIGGFFLTHVFGGRAVMMFVFGGIAMLLAAGLSVWVREMD